LPRPVGKAEGLAGTLQLGEHRAERFAIDVEEELAVGEAVRPRALHDGDRSDEITQEQEIQEIQEIGGNGRTALDSLTSWAGQLHPTRN
jgi:hypothetical protein